METQFYQISAFFFQENLTGQQYKYILKRFRENGTKHHALFCFLILRNPELLPVAIGMIKLACGMLIWLWLMGSHA